MLQHNLKIDACCIEFGETMTLNACSLVLYELTACPSVYIATYNCLSIRYVSEMNARREVAAFHPHFSHEVPKPSSVLMLLMLLPPN